MKTNEQLHRELWGWLAETGEQEKSKWPGWVEYYGTIAVEPSQDGSGTPIDNLCFACEESDYWCSDCPIQWGGGRRCIDESSIYCCWLDEENIDERKIIAAKIRDLPWGKKKEEE